MWQTQLFGLTLYQLFWYFVIYAVLGWCGEVIFCTVNTGAFVNRGFLNGPVCPIYGFGMLTVLCLLGPVADHLLLLFLGGMVFASLIELIAGFALEKIFHAQWWDYSKMPFNIGGYICLRFSLLWGLLIVFGVKVLHPPIADALATVPAIVGEIAAVPVTLLFLADLAVTVAEITRLDRSLGELEKVAGALHKVSDDLSAELGGRSLVAAAVAAEKSQVLGEKLDETKDKLGETKDAVADKLGETKEAVADKLGETKEAVVSKLGETKDVVADKLGETKDVVADKLGEAKDVVADKLGETKDVVAGKLGETKEAVADKLGETKEAVADKLGETKNAVTGKLGETRLQATLGAAQLAQSAAQLAQSAAQRKDSLQRRYEELSESYARALAGAGRRSRRLLAAFPDMSNRRHRAALDELHRRAAGKKGQ